MTAPTTPATHTVAANARLFWAEENCRMAHRALGIGPKTAKKIRAAEKAALALDEARAKGQA